MTPRYISPAQYDYLYQQWLRKRKHQTAIKKKLESWEP